MRARALGEVRRVGGVVLPDLPRRDDDLAVHLQLLHGHDDHVLAHLLHPLLAGQAALAERLLQPRLVAAELVGDDLLDARVHRLVGQLRARGLVGLQDQRPVDQHVAHHGEQRADALGLLRRRHLAQVEAVVQLLHHGVHRDHLVIHISRHPVIEGGLGTEHGGAQRQRQRQRQQRSLHGHSFSLSIPKIPPALRAAAPPLPRPRLGRAPSETLRGPGRNPKGFEANP